MDFTPEKRDLIYLTNAQNSIDGQNSATMQMMDGFTLLRLLNLLGAAGVKLTKEQLLDINSRLNKIKKPEGGKE